MSIWKLLPAQVHGLGDFGSAFALIAVALFVGGSGLAVTTGVAIGVVLVVVSILTDYPLGLVRVIPFKVHSAGDYVGAITLIAAPFLLGFTDSDGGLAAFYVAVGVTLVVVSLITDYDSAGQHAPAAVAA